MRGNSQAFEEDLIVCAVLKAPDKTGVDFQEVQPQVVYGIRLIEVVWVATPALGPKTSALCWRASI